jgi:hypothetical protein
MARATVSARDRLYAAVAWFGCLVGFGVAFVAAVLAFDIGPFGMTVLAGIAAMAGIGVANGVAFWRYSKALGGRRALALLMLVVAVGVAALGAVLVHVLFQAFNSSR